jgi:hypothetical protein
MVDILMPSSASPPIVEVHIWIGVYASGGEGILAMGLAAPIGAGTANMPMMHSRREIAARLEPTARRIMDKARGTADELTSVELRTFRAVQS